MEIILLLLCPLCTCILGSQDLPICMSLLFHIRIPIYVTVHYKIMPFMLLVFKELSSFDTFNQKSSGCKMYAFSLMEKI